jgi:hypothetical protein
VPVKEPVNDEFCDDRAGSATDPLVHKWTLLTRIEEVPFPEMQRRMENLCRRGGAEAGRLRRYRSVWLPTPAACPNFPRMSTLAEIETAADALPPAEKQELLLFLAARLRAGGPLPPPREFTREQIEAWIAQDEADWKRVQAAR